MRIQRARITPKQMEVLRLIAKTGYTNAEAAVTLGVSEQTIKNHKASIYRNLGVRNLTEVYIEMEWLHVPEDIAHD